MKRAEWLIVTVIIAMGLVCLIISANISCYTSIPEIVKSMGKYCLLMMAVAGLIGGVYFFVNRNRSNRR
ncbi:hypothetical protein RE628_19500 [Paenibacillus sp. D2_2]|uniref:hypothetical protein n=1 Tax=Paenibacillus sp. D2_2 TaxID=3073092 RepID=UPI002815C36F|nr:hypothetical protein [Paenibacillus sp. D2_2]WMT39573.1 hypothetical protein RE628_19500 [Paenibacillus sp. D2_2]